LITTLAPVTTFKHILASQHRPASKDGYQFDGRAVRQYKYRNLARALAQYAQKWHYTLEEIAGVLPQCSALWVMNLGGNQIGDQGAGVLAQDKSLPSK
jgi:hypothetical protein